MKRTVTLCILDGVGWGKRDHGDAFFTASTPNLDRLMANYPWALLKAHGTAVGMPSDGDMGNSEVGHNAMGAGRIFDQGAKLVNTAIETGSIWQSASWQQAIQGKTLHFLGLLSDGNVHSHIKHLLAMIKRADQSNVQRLRVHILTDGRDVERRSALQYIAALERTLGDIDRDYAIGSGGGRMWITMDRYEADWPMVKRGYDCHVHGQGRRFASAKQAIETLYAEDPKVDDQWLPAFVLNDYQGMQDGDAVIFFNFRGDRAIEISRAFEEQDFPFFDRGQHPAVFYAGMMEYDGDLKIPKNHLVAPPVIDNTVGDQLAAAQKSVLAISETQKFGHVTFFFNGNRSAPLPGEQQQEIESLNVPFDQRPEMRAQEVTDKVCEAIRSGQFDHIRLNLANGDMVGHTGNFAATVAAIELLDSCIAQLEQATQDIGAMLLITADHGNADEMYLYDKKKKSYKTNTNGQKVVSTSHSKNPVPLILFDAQQEWTLCQTEETTLGGIAQLGATVLALCDVPIPPDYLPSLVKKT